MKLKLISAVPAALLLAFALSGCSRNDDKLVMVTEATFPPYEFREGGKILEYAEVGHDILPFRLPGGPLGVWAAFGGRCARAVLPVRKRYAFFANQKRHFVPDGVHQSAMRTEQPGMRVHNFQGIAAVRAVHKSRHGQDHDVLRVRGAGHAGRTPSPPVQK